MKRILCLAVATFALCLVTTASQAQSESLKIRIHVPFSFTVGNTTFDAGDYVVTEPSNLVLRMQSQSDRMAIVQHVQTAHSRKESDGQVKLIFHRYSNQNFLAVVSNGSWESTFDFQESDKEEQIASVSPSRQFRVVSVLTDGTTEAGNIGQ